MIDVAKTAEALATIVAVIASHVRTNRRRDHQVEALRRQLLQVRHQLVHLRKQVERWSHLP